MAVHALKINHQCLVCTCPMQVTREVISDLEASKYQMVEWR